MSEPNLVVQTPKGESKRDSNRREFFSGLTIFGSAILIAVLIILFIFRSYQVEGPSMESTLNDGDKLIIWKLPKTWSSVTGHAYVPGRGDIIVFTESGLATYGQTNTKQLIKRVIGLPGDHIVIRNNEYIIYNHTHPEGFDPDKTLGYGKHIPPTSGNVDLTLGPKQLFVSGDNRGDSLDSRAFGPISTSQVVGKLVLRLFPINKAEFF